MPIEDSHALARVVDYIHLNPVRAKVVSPEHLVGYRWSSLKAFLKGSKPRCLNAEIWLMARGGWMENAEGVSAYVGYLREMAKDEAAWTREGLVGLAKGWVIGTSGWRKALAKEHDQLRMGSGMAAQERRELREAAWGGALEDGLRQLGKMESDLATKPRKQPWKLDLALKLREEHGARIAWLASHLQLGQATTVRSYLHLWRRKN